MNLKRIEKCFNRALLLSFSKKKLLLTFSTLILCGILFVFCKTLSIETSGWTSLAFVFLPLFLSSGILLALGVLLIRIYHHEVKAMKVSLRSLFSSSWDLLIGTSYLSVPPLLVYLLLWMILGFFLLLKQIPSVGEFIGVILAFGPFLLIFSSLVLICLNLVLLFFAAPAIALKKMGRLKLAKSLFQQFKENTFTNMTLFILALLPLGFIVGLLFLSAYIMSISYFEMGSNLTKTLSWFFIMVPLSCIITPAVIFFFNFAAESYNTLYLQD